MITDEQGREWLLKKLYDDGWRYYVKASNGCTYLTKEKPDFCENGKSINPYSGGTTKCTDSFVTFIHGIKVNEMLDIGKELGIVDWFEVPVDTPVLVSSNGIIWKRMYFAKVGYGGEVYVWDNGATSWSAKDSKDVTAWTHIKLAEV